MWTRAQPPADVSLTTANNPLTVNLGTNQNFNDADFGYRGDSPICEGGTRNLAVVSGARDVYGGSAKDAQDDECVKILSRPGAIGDLVWRDDDGDAIQDVGEPGLANVQVDLYRDSNDSGNLEIGVDDMVDTLFTDADGGYLFKNVPPGIYFVDVTDAANPNGPLAGRPHTVGQQSLDDPGGPIILFPGEVFKDADFGYEPIPDDGYAILGDTVWYDDDGDGFQQPWEPGIPGVTVCTTPQSGFIPPACDLTDANGKYEIPVLPGTYLVGSSRPAGLTPTTPEQHGPVTVVADDKYWDADFGYNDSLTNPRLGKIGNLVFLDKDQDGRFDSNESPQAGVSVDLIRDSNNNGQWDDGEPIIATTTSASSLGLNNSNYLFTGVPQGRYLVHVSDTNGVLTDFIKSPVPAPGTDNTNQNDPYPVYLVNPGNNNYTADFGYYKPDIPDTGVIGNQVWIESDGDGIFNPTHKDFGQHGVTVELWEGGSVIATTTTGASGDYAFLHLPDGVLY